MACWRWCNNDALLKWSNMHDTRVECFVGSGPRNVFWCFTWFSPRIVIIHCQSECMAFHTAAAAVLLQALTVAQKLPYLSWWIYYTLKCIMKYSGSHLAIRHSLYFVPDCLSREICCFFLLSIMVTLTISSLAALPVYLFYWHLWTRARWHTSYIYIYGMEFVPTSLSK